jgi:hypothetical protein
MICLLITASLKTASRVTGPLSSRSSVEAATEQLLQRERFVVSSRTIDSTCLVWVLISKTLAPALYYFADTVPIPDILRHAAKAFLLLAHAVL